MNTSIQIVLLGAVLVIGYVVLSDRGLGSPPPRTEAEKLLDTAHSGVSLGREIANLFGLQGASSMSKGVDGGPQVKTWSL